MSIKMSDQSSMCCHVIRGRKLYDRFLRGTGQCIYRPQRLLCRHDAPEEKQQEKSGTLRYFPAVQTEQAGQYKQNANNP